MDEQYLMLKNVLKQFNDITYYIIKYNIKKLKKNHVGDLRRGWHVGSFSKATTPRCRWERFSFPWITPLYPWSVCYNAEC